MGAQAFDGGAIEICGHDIAREPIAAKRVLAYVPDNPDIYEFMTGMQYLTYLADIYEVPAQNRMERIEGWHVGSISSTRSATPSPPTRTA